MEKLIIDTFAKKNNSTNLMFLSKLNFEFMDLEWIPNSLRSALRDILEVGNQTPFRSYYQWSAKAIYSYAKDKNIKEVVELGAGCAPITRQIINEFPDWPVQLTITDLNPDRLNFKNLSKTDSRVNAVYHSIDFTQKIDGFQNSLLVLSATFHHVPEKLKKKILLNLKSLSPHVIILEPLRPTLTSFLFVFGSLISSFLTPIFRLNAKLFFRSFFWCWVVPIAPILFLWDGWVSCIRCWSKRDWICHEPKAVVEETVFCTKVILK